MEHEEICPVCKLEEIRSLLDSLHEGLALVYRSVADVEASVKEVMDCGDEAQDEPGPVEAELQTRIPGA